MKCPSPNSVLTSGENQSASEPAHGVPGGEQGSSGCQFTRSPVCMRGIAIPSSWRRSSFSPWQLLPSFLPAQSCRGARLVRTPSAEHRSRSFSTRSLSGHSHDHDVKLDLARRRAAVAGHRATRHRAPGRRHLGRGEHGEREPGDGAAPYRRPGPARQPVARPGPDHGQLRRAEPPPAISPTARRRTSSRRTRAATRSSSTRSKASSRSSTSWATPITCAARSPATTPPFSSTRRCRASWQSRAGRC